MSSVNHSALTSESAAQNEQYSEENTRDDFDSIGNFEGFLVISYHDCKLAIAFYRPGYDKIELLHEVYEYNDFSYIKKILRKLEPTDIVISSKCDTRLVNLLKEFSLNINESEKNFDSENVLSNSLDSYNFATSKPDKGNQIYSRFKLHILSNRLFQYEQCKSRILAMNLPQMENMVDRTERFIYLTSNINFSEINTIKALGVLLYFLEKNLSCNNMISGTNSLLSDFSYLNLYYVTMDEITFEALEIFQQEWHPSTMKKGIYKKEGLSVYGIFNTCSSKLGSHHLKKIFQQPVTDYDVLTDRQTIIDYFINPANNNFKESLLDTLKHIKDISPAFNRLKVSKFQFCDFENLFNSVFHLIILRNTVAKFEPKLKIFSQIKNVFTNELEEVHDCLRTIIDFEKSSTNSIEIRSNIDEELDELRFLCNKLPELLNRVLLDESEENNLLSLDLRHLTNVYVPQIGFLLAIPLMEAQKVTNLEEYGFETIFCANDRTFYKNKKMKEFDIYYGDITFNIAEQTRKVLVGSRDFILQRKKTVISSIELCAQLDAIIAMAQAAISYNLVRPALSCYGAINIDQGRHPLYELMGQSFVANSFVSDEDVCKISILFGPNSCGKSVYLKQVSLIIYLAHIGSYVPARNAEISIVDQIFTRIRTPESISTQLSSFKHDLNQIIMATKYASRRSLVVIDFFGKGTLSIDGFSLLSACIKHWAKSHNRPHAIISSQFNLMPALSSSTQIKFYTFKTVAGVNSFSLIECENQSHNQDNSTFSATQILGAIPQSIERIFSDTFSEELQQSFPDLDHRYRKFLELSDCVNSFDATNESQHDKFLAKISTMIDSLTK